MHLASLMLFGPSICDVQQGQTVNTPPCGLVLLNNSDFLVSAFSYLRYNDSWAVLADAEDTETGPGRRLVAEPGHLLRPRPPVVSQHRAVAQIAPTAVQHSSPLGRGSNHVVCVVACFAE